MNMQNIKLVVIGDSGVGKTAVIVSYHEDGFPNEHLPKVCDNITSLIKLNKMSIQLGIWDVSGHKDFDRLRPLSYPRTDVFLLMYDISNKDSLKNLAIKWAPEKEHHVPYAPFGIIGCKSDLRKEMNNLPVNDELNELRLSLVIYRWLSISTIDHNLMDKMVLDMIIRYAKCTKSRQDYCRYEDGEAMARELGASGYMECSALSQEGLEEIFEAACTWALGRDKAKKLFQKNYDKKVKNKKDCVIL